MVLRGVFGVTSESVIMRATITIASTMRVGIAYLQNNSMPFETPRYMRTKFSENEKRKYTRTPPSPNLSELPFPPAPTKSAKKPPDSPRFLKSSEPKRKLAAYPRHHASI